MGSLSRITTTRWGAVVAALGLVLSLIIGFANPADATSTVSTTGQNRLGTVSGTVDGKVISVPAGLIGVDADGDGSTDAWAYCIDLATRLVPGTYTEGSWDAATVPELGKIAWILHHYPAAADTTTDLAMAVQAAIWHFSDGFELATGQGDNSESVEDQYAYIVAKAAPIPEPRPTLTLTPTVQQAEAGTGLVFGVRSSATGPVTVALEKGPVGATVRPVGPDRTCDMAAPPITRVALVEGTGEVCVHAPGPGGPAMFTAVVTQATAIGRVFLRAGSQKLVFAGGGTVAATASATATWIDPPVTTTTAPATTTAPTTPTTSVAVGLPPTSAEPPVTAASPLQAAPTSATTEPQPVLEAQPLALLPRTGSDPGRHVGLALGLALTGFGSAAVAKGHRTR